MEFTTVEAFLEAISVMCNDVAVDVLDLKNRLDSTKWNPEETGGYLDVMVNGRFKDRATSLKFSSPLRLSLCHQSMLSQKIEIVLLMEPL